MRANTVGDARAAATDWVNQEKARCAGYVGAYFSGSTVVLSADQPMPLGSDVDIVVVTEQVPAGGKVGKVARGGVLLDVSHRPWAQISPAEIALADYHLASGLCNGMIVDDPSGALRLLQSDIAALFFDEIYVRRRCDNVVDKIQNGLAAYEAAAPWPDQVLSWLFPTGILMHLILVAALRNPTVRLRFLSGRRVLEAYGLEERYPDFIDLIDCRRLAPERVVHHIGRLAKSFDAAAAVAETPFPFSSDICAVGRPTAIDASLELVRQGDHREALFWILATFARCHKILLADSPSGPGEELASDFNVLLADIGILSAADLQPRADATLSFLPRAREISEVLISRNPGIRR